MDLFGAADADVVGYEGLEETAGTAGVVEDDGARYLDLAHRQLPEVSGLSVDIGERDMSTVNRDCYSVVVTTDSAGVTRSAVVTGAARGIGLAIGQRLADDGWLVVGVDRDGDRLSLAMDSIGGVAVGGDVREGEVLAAARSAAEVCTLSAWVNNAGLVRLGPLHDMDPAAIHEVLSVDLCAVVMGTREALSSYLANDVPGSIVNISSIHARAAFPGFAAYDTAKGGVEALSRSVCVEYGHLGIRCNTVAPGAVRTDIVSYPHAHGLDDVDGTTRTPGVGGGHGPLADLHPPVENMAPMRRQSEPMEIAHAVAFLLDPRSKAVNGHCLAVDNGMSSWSYAFEPDPTVGFKRR